MIPLNKLTGRLGNQLFQFAYIFGQMKLDHIPDIYVQDPKYFEHCASEVKQMFSGDLINKVDMIAIHVRRGDYVNNPFYVDLMETDYYREAMAIFPNEDFLVFSDDIEWCKQQTIFKDCEFSEGNELEDLNLMASCKAVITANSSFSWWGGFLCNGKVVAPSNKNWYSDKIERTKCPSNWIRI